MISPVEGDPGRHRAAPDLVRRELEVRRLHRVGQEAALAEQLEVPAGDADATEFALVLERPELAAQTTKVDRVPRSGKQGTMTVIMGVIMGSTGVERRLRRPHVRSARAVRK